MADRPPPHVTRDNPGTGNTTTATRDHPGQGSTTNVTQNPESRSKTNIGLIVGGLVVAVLVLAFFMFRGDSSSVDGVNTTTQGGAGAIESTTEGAGVAGTEGAGVAGTEGVGVADEGAADTVADPADPAATQTGD